MKECSARRFYEIHADCGGVPDMWFLDEPRDVTGRELDARDFRSGQVYRGPQPVVVPVGQPGRETAFSLGAFDMPVVSSDAWEVIEAIAPNDVQPIPVTVPNAKRTFSILNVIALLDCLDEGRSDFTRWTEEDNRPDRLGEIHVMWQLFVDPTRTGDHHLFRVKGWHFALLVSEALKSALEKVPDLGLTFQPAS